MEPLERLKRDNFPEEVPEAMCRAPALNPTQLIEGREEEEEEEEEEGMV